MSILNVTPDSFSDGGKCTTLADAVAAALRQRDQGAAIIDIGGESTRPGSLPVNAAEEAARVVPVVEALAREKGLIISVDTRKSEVARLALQAGAHIINDVTAMQDNPQYHDVKTQVAAHLRDRMQLAIAAGVNPQAIALDPGIGFGKNYTHNVQLLGPGGTDQILALGRPLLLGVSRKSYLGTLLGRQVADRLAGTLATLAVAISRRSAHILRVHDVAPTVDLVKVWRELDSV